MKVLVVGGAGYIGSHVVYELIRNKYDVVVLDNLSTGNRKAIHKEAKFYNGDQLDRNILSKIFKENIIDVVMHFAAKSVVSESVKQPLIYFKNNIYGVVVLLEVMKENNIKNIIFSSTAAVYGESNKMPISEDDLKNPINPYGTSKLAAEWLIQSTAKVHDMNYVIFRYFNVAGADVSGQIGQATNGKKITHLIPNIIKTVIGEKTCIQIFGNDYKTRDGTNIRDYVHVTDIAIAHLKGLKYVLNKKSNIFNIGSENGFTVTEIIKTTEKILDLKINHEYVKRRHGDPVALVASSHKILKELNFKLNFSLKDMIESDLKWRKDRKF